MPARLKLPGPPGTHGDPGITGPVGSMGPMGDPGLDGLQGAPGLKGIAGLLGRDGIPGLPGHDGDSGIDGLEGIRGNQGSQGYHGRAGQPGAPARSRGYYFSRHSQTTNVPECPEDTDLMWSGYSLLYVQGNKLAHGQDLGKFIVTGLDFLYSSSSCVNKLKKLMLRYLCSIDELY